MRNTEKKFPVAEYFLSPQGEGLYSGTLMWFFRLAGCSVGKKMTVEERAAFSAVEGKVLPLYRERCTLYDERVFACDTNFQTKEVLTVAQILERVPAGVKHICLTGGEPLDHDLRPLLEELAGSDYDVHIETSGTVSLTDRAYPQYSEYDSIGYPEGWLWVTVSPKKGLLSEMVGIANEIKLLVDENFELEKVPQEILDHELVWLQPINEEFEIDKKNLDRCLSLQKEHPNWRISSQSHKLWNVR